jgi:hypothetical protein
VVKKCPRSKTKKEWRKVSRSMQENQGGKSLEINKGWAISKGVGKNGLEKLEAKKNQAKTWLKKKH